MQYSEKVLDHFTHPRNVGEIEDANGVGEVGNAKCGDIMKIYLKVSDDGIIEDVKFKTFGCGAATRCTAPCWQRKRCALQFPTITSVWARTRRRFSAAMQTVRPATRQTNTHIPQKIRITLGQIEKSALLVSQ